jgi:hypothetical protein
MITEDAIRRLLKLSSMKRSARTRRIVLAVVFITMGCVAAVRAQDDVPSSDLRFVVLRDYNGKPVRNAAVVLHPVNSKGKQARGGMELKTDTDGKTNFEGVPYGVLRVQVLAQGFQTYGEDFNIDKPSMEITIKLKRPQGQYSVYDPPKKSEEKQEEKKPPDQKPQ